MTEYKPLQTIAYENLREMIYSRQLEFGVIYSETRLASELNISRTPVRDALNRMSRERYIDILPNRGFQLHKPDEDDVREAYHVRRMIERYCGEMLAQGAGTMRAQRAISQMKDSLERQKALVGLDSDVDLQSFWMEDQRFHFAPLNYLNISAFNMQYDSFLHIFMPQNLKDDYVVGRSHSTIAEHLAIIQALEAGDVSATLTAIDNHLASTLRLATLMLTAESASSITSLPNQAE